MSIPINNDKKAHVIIKKFILNSFLSINLFITKNKIKNLRNKTDLIICSLYRVLSLRD